MRTFVIASSILLALGAVAPARGEAWLSEEEAGWTRLVEGEDFAHLMAAAETLAPWPPTRSAAAAGAGQEADAEARRRQLADRLLRQLDAFRGVIRKLPASGLAPALNGLLALRRAIGGAAGYVNLLAADALNRVLIAEVARRLVDDERAFTVSPELLTALRGYRLDVRALVAVAEVEVGADLAFEVPNGEAPVRTLARLIESVTGDIEMAFAPLADLEGTGVFALLERPDFGKLLSRLWLTDQRLHVALPLLAAYATANPGRPLAADIEAIGRAVDLKSLERGPYGTPLSRATPMAVYDVAGLIRTVRDGQIELFAALDPSL